MTTVAWHTGLALAGYAAFMAAGVSGLAYLSQERQLKRKNPAFLRRRVSSLETLDRVNLWALWAGFVLFTFGVLNGVWLARGGRMGWGDPKTVFALATWGAYAALLVVRTTTISRGPKVAALSVLGVLLVGWTFLGVNMFLQTRHVF